MINVKGFSQQSSWPYEIRKNSYVIKVYEPENETYINHKVKSKAAISVQLPNSETPVFGMIWTTALLDADRDNKMAKLLSVEIDEIRFPDSVSESNQTQLQNLLETEIPKWDIEVSIPDLVNSLKEVSAHVNDLKAVAPNFIFTTEPSVLVIIDGAPKFKAVAKPYELLQNSSAFIAKDKSTQNFYLKGGDFWYSSQNINGPWKSGAKVPKKLQEIANESVTENIENGETPYVGSAPKIIIGSVGSELINIEGEPAYTPLQNTDLLYVKNSDSDLFMDVKTQKYYILTSGRWFTSSNIKGPWSHLLSDELPIDFKSIDPESNKGHTLASIAGTKEAKDAIYDAQIPQTAAVNRATTKASDIEYNGQPEFEKIQGLNLEHAVNTESSVFKDGKKYYLCDNGIWFVSNSPEGPWEVSDNRPKEVNKIPASNPSYHTKYVYIYETSPTVVYVGYTPGYAGSYIYHNTVVYGTGYYYNPWYNGYYYHRRYTYGFNIRYNYWNGWSFSFSFGSPFSWWGYNYWHPGWYNWGPHYYRPPYYHRGHYYHHHYRPPYHRRDGVSPYRRRDVRPNPTPKPIPRPNPTPKPMPRPNPTPKPMPKPAPAPRPMPRPATKPNYRPSIRPHFNTHTPSRSTMSRPTRQTMGKYRRR